MSGLSRVLNKRDPYERLLRQFTTGIESRIVEAAIKESQSETDIEAYLAVVRQELARIIAAIQDVLPAEEAPADFTS